MTRPHACVGSDDEGNFPVVLTTNATANGGIENIAPWIPPSLSNSATRQSSPVVNFVALRMGHHAGRSGYDRLMEYVEGTTVEACHSAGLSERITAKVLKPLLRRSGSAWYHRRSLMGEIGAMRRWMSTAGQIFHFLYGENSFRYLGHLKALSRRHAIVSSYHTPLWRLRQLITKPAHLRRLDAAVVVSSVQREFFEKMIGVERTFFIPHGIDTDYFRPLPRSKEREGARRCIVVGHYLRDFETLVEAIGMIGKRSNGLTFVVVTQRARFPCFNGLPNVELHSGLPDHALRQLYRSADLLLLPLLDSTANNALLEGMACGLPVVSTDLPGVRDYLDAQCGLLVPKQDANALAEAVVALRDQPDLRKRMGLASRARALRFAWPTIAEAFQALYRNVAVSP